MTNPIVTVFGGTGFLGRRLVRHLTSQGFLARIASRHPKGEGIRADIRDEGAVDAAIAGAYGVVNAISLYREGGTETFQALHVKAAGQLASQAKRAGVERFIHVSGIGADPTSRSSYIRSRGEGELAVRAVFANATIVRPAVMFGDDDAFLNTIVELLRRLPVYPVFGRGLTQIQPVFVEDVAEAIARAALNPKAPDGCELGGPRVYTYRDLLAEIAARLGKRPLFVSVPFTLWHLLARIPGSPVSRNQVELMETDTVASPETPGFDAFGIAPRPIAHTLEKIIVAA
jgi:uncharacterized protein YbjT (DUF2867 family)